MKTEINTAIAERALAGERLTEAELTELDSVDVLLLGMLADEVRRARVGGEVTYTRVLDVGPGADPAALGERSTNADEVRIHQPGA
jgi:2-iminoacetate synthase ThiH